MTDVNERLFFHEYDSETDTYHRYIGVVRVVPGGMNVNVRHGKRHVRIEDETVPQGFRNINNVENIEPLGLAYWGEDFWTHHPDSQT